MAKTRPFERRTIDELAVRDERAFRSVPLYAELKDVLRRSAYSFRVMPSSHEDRADLALLYNLTFWGAKEGGDVLEGPRIDADVVAHVAWHHLAARAFAPARREALSVEALLLGESIASAFDLYLVGQLLRRATRSSFLDTQVPAMARSAEGAALGRRGFERLLRAVAADPERAFGEMRTLLFDAASTLFACSSAERAHAALASKDDHPLSPLLLRYELSNWVLFARAYATRALDASRAATRTRAVDAGLRTEKRPLSWLAARWLTPEGRERSPKK